MGLKQDFNQLLRPYYIINIFLSLSYIIFKRIPFLCNYFFGNECEFDGRETEILFFLIIVVMIRTRKAGSVSMINYLSSSFIYTKIANLILWFNADLIMGIVFGIIFIFGAFLVPEPTYSGTDKVVYFRGLQNLDEELTRDQDTAWLIAFYTVWNPTCVNFAPIFSKLSNDYAIQRLRFAKIDIGRYPDAGKKYGVSDSSFSKQLPTLVLFKNGKEVLRRPLVDSKNHVIRFPFTEDSIKNVFGLNDLYETCKSATKSVKAKSE